MQGKCSVNASVTLLATIASKYSTLLGIAKQPRGQTGVVTGGRFLGKEVLCDS